MAQGTRGRPRKKSKLGDVLSPHLCYTLSCQAQTCFCLSSAGEGRTRRKKEERETMFRKLMATELIVRDLATCTAF